MTVAPNAKMSAATTSSTVRVEAAGRSWSSCMVEPHRAAQDGAGGRGGRARPPAGPRYLARNPASFISSRWRCSVFATQSRYSLPVIVVWLNAPRAMNSFHSGVARTFLKSSS